MKKPAQQTEAQSQASSGPAVLAHPGNTWANQASTRSGGSRVIDESHLASPEAALPTAAAPMTSEEN